MACLFLNQTFHLPTSIFMAEAVVPAASATAAKVAVLTASDRAAGGVYEDKSGPAVVEMLKLFSEPWS